MHAQAPLACIPLTVYSCAHIHTHVGFSNALITLPRGARAHTRTRCSASPRRIANAPPPFVWPTRCTRSGRASSFASCLIRRENFFERRREIESAQRVLHTRDTNNMQIAGIYGDPGRSTRGVMGKIRHNGGTSRWGRWKMGRN